MTNRGYDFEKERKIREIRAPHHLLCLLRSRYYRSDYTKAKEGPLQREEFLGQENTKSPRRRQKKDIGERESRKLGLEIEEGKSFYDSARMRRGER